MTPERTPEGKWVIYARATGDRFERWSVDARAMLATGEYTADPSTGDDRHTASVAPGPELALAPAPLPTEHSPGVPLVAVKAEDAPPAQPVQIPDAPRRRRR